VEWRLREFLIPSSATLKKRMNIVFAGTVAELRIFLAHLRVKEELLQLHIKQAQLKAKWYGSK